MRCFTAGVCFPLFAAITRIGRCYSCALDLYQDTPAESHFQFCLARAESLKEHRVKPFFVFDGRTPQIKQAEVAQRLRDKAVNAQKVAESLKAGDKNRAYEFASRVASAVFCASRLLCHTLPLSQCIHVTREMILDLVRRLKEKGIDYLIAPYEADAQMVFLCKEGLADAIITEDSDLLVYSAVCDRSLPILTKMTSEGEYIEFSLDSMLAHVALRGFPRELFVAACILSGCDYLSNIPNIGIAKVLKNLQSVKSTASGAEAIIDHFLKSVASVKNAVVPTGFRESFLTAFAAFYGHLVFDPRQRRIIPITGSTLSSSAGFSFCGPPLTDDEVTLLCQSSLTPEPSVPSTPVPSRGASALQLASPSLRTPSGSSLRRHSSMSDFFRSPKSCSPSSSSPSIHSTTPLSPLDGGGGEGSTPESSHSIQEIELNVCAKTAALSHWKHRRSNHGILLDSSEESQGSNAGDSLESPSQESPSVLERASIAPASFYKKPRFF